jgi:hypothetical protein
MLFVELPCLEAKYQIRMTIPGFSMSPLGRRSQIAGKNMDPIDTNLG